MKPNLVLRLSVPLIGLGALSVFAALFIENTGLYHAILSWAGTFHSPFGDLQYIFAAADCWQHGADVYLGGFCDVLGRPFDSAPLWLRLPWAAAAMGATNLLGLALLIAFLGSLVFLYTPKRGRDVVLLLLATSSTTIIFALERANADVIIFVMVVAAGTLLRERSVAKTVGYPILLLAGLLKFYPLVLLGLSLRERLRTCIVVCALSLAVVALFILSFHGELAAMLSNIPAGSYFTDLFGAENLPWGLEQLARGSTVGEAAPYLPFAVLAALVAFVAYRALRLASEPAFRQAWAELPASDALFLVAGAAMVFACFFAGQSPGHRSIHLLLVMPGLLTLSQVTPGPFHRARMLRLILMIIYLMWSDCFRHAAESFMLDDRIPLALWLLREGFWWLVVGSFGGLLLCFVSEAMRQLGAEWRLGRVSHRLSRR